MEYIFYFFLWTFVLYWIHRIGHKTPYIKECHRHHHVYVIKTITGWHWNNLFLFNDDWPSTIDLWFTEVIPTIIFSVITGQYWLCVFYYIWAAFLQESIEHNSKFDLKGFTSGKWHLIHHRQPTKNYGLFFPQWDILFNTYKSVR